MGMTRRAGEDLLHDSAGPLPAGLVSLENDLDDEARVDLLPELPVHRTYLTARPPTGALAATGGQRFRRRGLPVEGWASWSELSGWEGVR
jgi:hypothetical protein